MLSFLALILVFSCVALLLTGKVSPFVIFSTLPVFIALIAGFAPADIYQFFLAGLTKVTPIAVMFIFAILFFSLLQERGLFEPIISLIIRKAGQHLVMIPMATVLIATIAHIDGSGASTFLICIPALLPIYERLKLSPYLLLLLVSASASVMNMLPWAGPLGRAASVIESDPTQLWYPLIPIQMCAFIILLVAAYFLGRREEARLLTETQGSHVLDDQDATLHPKALPDHPPSNQSLLSSNWWLNLSLTLMIITLLVSGILPSALVFMIALSLALLINRLSLDEQQAFLKRHAWNALHMAMIIFAAGVFLGVLKESKMLHALSESLMHILPQQLLTHIHIIVGIFGAPFELILNTDAYYFALLPIVDQAVQPHAVSSQSVVYAMLIGNIIGTFISPFSPALWLGLGLAKLEIGPYIRYAFAWIWGLSLILMLIAWSLKLF